MSDIGGIGNVQPASFQPQQDQVQQGQSGEDFESVAQVLNAQITEIEEALDVDEDKDELTKLIDAEKARLSGAKFEGRYSIRDLFS